MTAEQGAHDLVVLHPAGRIDVRVELEGAGDATQVKRASLLRTARKIMQGELHIPDYVLSRPKRPHVESAGDIINIVVPTSAGGGNDVIARAIAQQLGRLLGQRVTVDNRAGSAGSIAAEFVARAAPDGRTLMLGYIGTHAMNPALQTLRYDPLVDFEPVGLVAWSPTLLVANSTLAVRDVADLIGQLKAEPERYAYASAGKGTAPHFAAELFKLNAGVQLLHLPHPGAAPAITDTVAGDAAVMFPSLLTAEPFIRSGKLRALAVAGPERVPNLPDVPTLEEAGVKGVDVTQWYGLFAPAGTPAAIVAGLSAALNAVLLEPAVVQRIEDHGATVRATSPDDLRSLVADELAKWRGVVRQARLSPN
jgi:hypothetical protein